MDKASIIKARELFGNERARIIGDNVIIGYNNMPGEMAVNPVWDDDNEILLMFKADTGEDMGNVCPLEVTFTTYENIQYIEKKDNIIRESRRCALYP